MPKKTFDQHFASQFMGIDGESSALELSLGRVNRAVNYEPAVSNSLRGRVGCQVAGSPCGFFAIFPYRYTRTQDEYAIKYQTVSAGVASLGTTKTTADGASIEKLIAINQQLWVSDTMTIPITRVSGTYPFTWYNTVSGSNINLIIKANGVTILNNSCADGLTSETTIYALLQAIDAIAELSVSVTTRGTCPPVAVVNGAQTTTFVANTEYGKRYSVTVSAGHTFYPGDVITFHTLGALSGGFVTNTTGTTITYAGQQVTLTNGQILGYMGQSCAAMPITSVQSAASGTLNISFPYWRLVLEGDASDTLYNYGNIFGTAYSLWAAKTTGSFYAPPTYVNLQGNLYIASSTGSKLTTYGYSNSLIKMDGLTAVRAGFNAPTVGASATAAGALSGTYKYKAFMRRVDAQGNITEGPVSNIFTQVYAAQYGTVAVTSDHYSGFGWAGRSAMKYTSESPNAGIYFAVDDGNGAPGLDGFLQPGDPICLLETNTAQKAGLWHSAFGVDVVGLLHRTVCTDYDGSTAPSALRVADSNGYNIADNAQISTGITCVVLRTAAGGNQYYYLCELPISNLAAAGGDAFFDNVTDAVLTAAAKYDEIPVGKEHNAPPACSLVCEHQGGLVVARGFATPNTVGFSSLDGPEYFPTASNTFDVPSTQSGAITAIASDTSDRLAVFKERAYYDVSGDLDGGIFSVNVQNEGDYGITSQASLIRADGVLLGLSKNGWVVISDGELDSKASRGLNARVMNQAYNFAWAVAVNDSFNRAYICSIPQVSGEPVTYVIDYSRERSLPLERVHTTKIDPAGGMAMMGNTLYHLSQTSPYCVFRRLQRFSGDSPSGNGNGDSFIDNTNAISYILESKPINLGEPQVLNQPVRARVWSIPNDYVVDGWVGFSCSVEGGASAKASSVGIAQPRGTAAPITFSLETDLFKDVKLVQSKTHFYILRLTTNTIRTAPFITGFVVGYAEDYNPDDLVK